MSDNVMGSSRELERGQAPIAKVAYSLACGAIAWDVRRVEVRERIAAPYRATVHAITADAAALPDELVGADAELLLDRRDLARAVYGVVTRVETASQQQAQSGRLHVKLRIEPALAILGRGRCSRIFQELSVPQIVEAVIGPVLGARGREFEFRFDVGRYAPRDYCVQYRESDLDFVQRLLEEEGIAYCFEERDGRELVVFVDAGEQFAAAPVLDDQPVELVGDRAEQYVAETVWKFAWTSRPVSPAVSQRDFDWMAAPARALEAGFLGTVDAGVEPIQPLPDAEVYAHGDRRVLELDLEARAQRKQEALAAGDAAGRGVGNVTGFAPGRTFELLGHTDGARDIRYLLLECVHRGDCPDVDPAVGGEAKDRGPNYENTFRCMPADVVFRPPSATPKPSVLGPQTAVVTGPPGEEIHVDPHGRIKVRMQWDRADTPDEEASCWIRVAQSWGGAGWGTMFIPRVGMEVVVMFLDGDPDRPLVVGSVYNGGNTPPYSLPDDKTKSTIRTRSTPGGEGFNELRFDDAAGSEEIYVHAQRNLNEQIGSCHSTSVGSDQNLSVGQHRTQNVGGDEHVHIEKDRWLDVVGGQAVTIGGSQKTVVAGGPALGSAGSPAIPGAELQVTGDYVVDVSHRITLRVGPTTVTIDSMGIHLEAPQHITMNVGGTFMSLTPAMLGAFAPDMRMTTPGAALHMATEANLSSPSKVALSSVASTLTLDANAALTGTTACITADTDLSLSGTTAKLEAATSLDLSAGATAAMTAGGAHVTLAAGLARIND